MRIKNPDPGAGDKNTWKSSGKNMVLNRLPLLWNCVSPKHLENLSCLLLQLHRISLNAIIYIHAGALALELRFWLPD